jgi:signal peptidase II
MKKDKNHWFFIVAVLLLIFDQVTKLAVKGFDIFGFSHQGMYLGQSIPVIGDFLQWTYVENEGMAFGIKFGVWKIFLSLFSIVAAVLLGWYLNKLRGFNFWVRMGIMLIFAGALGNLVDRVFYGVIFNEGPLFYGRVVDFVQVDIPDISFLGLNYSHWPVFNVADSCVSCGVVTLLLAHKYIPGFKQLSGKEQLTEHADNNSINEQDENERSAV